MLSFSPIEIQWRNWKALKTIVKIKRFEPAFYSEDTSGKNKNINRKLHFIILKQ